MKKLLLLLLLAGCSQNQIIHERIDPDGKVTERITFKQNLVMYFTRKKNIHGKYNNEGLEFHIDGSDQIPDSNAVKALAEGVVEGLKYGY